MGCGGSKLDSEAVRLCRERKNLVKAARDSWHSLASTHLGYFESLISVQNQLKIFMEEAIVFNLNRVSDAGPDDPIREERTSLENFTPEPNENRGTNGEETESDGASTDCFVSTDSEDVFEDSPEHQKEITSRERPLGNLPHPRDRIGASAEHTSCDIYKVHGQRMVLRPYMFNPSQNQAPIQVDSSLEPDFEFTFGARQFSGDWMANSWLIHEMSGSPHNYVLNPPQENVWNDQTDHDVSSWENMGPLSLAHHDFQGTHESGLGSHEINLREVREREGIPYLEDEFGDPVEDTVDDESMELDDESLELDDDLEECPFELNTGNNGQDVRPDQGGEVGCTDDGLTNINNRKKEEIGEEDWEHDTSSSVPESLIVEAREKFGSCDQEAVQKKMGKVESHDIPSEINQISTEFMSKMSTHCSWDLHQVLKKMNEAFADIIMHGDDVSRMFGPHQPITVSDTGYSFCNKLYANSSRIISALASGILRRLPRRILKSVSITCQDHSNETNTSSCNLSLTLEKLCIWESKLHREVKVQEKVQRALDKGQRKLKELCDKGVQPSRVDTSDASMEKLIARIRVAFIVVEGIATRVHGIRDEELYPLICDLIQRFHQMWKRLHGSHKKQVCAIMKVQTNAQIRCSYSSLKAIQGLEIEVTKLKKAFLKWISSHRIFANLLKSWIAKFLPPNNTAHQSSPSTLELLDMCNRWSNLVESVLSVQVIQALNNLILLLQLLRKRLCEQQHQRLIMDYLSSYYVKELEKVCMESGISSEEYASFVKALDVASSSAKIDPRFSSVHARYLSLRTNRIKHKEAYLKHEVARKELEAAAHNLIQQGLIPVLEALQNFSSDMSNAFDEIIIVPKE